jgi:hypothetical protein
VPVSAGAAAGVTGQRPQHVSARTNDAEARTAPAHLADQRLDLRIRLAGLIGGVVGMAGQPR